MIRTIFEFLASAAGLYSLLLFARILLTWFGGLRDSGLTQFLARITDPYLDWWRRHLHLRIGFLDLSPLAGILALSVLQSVASTIAAYGSIHIGAIFAIVVSGLWSVVSFLLGFCIIVLAIRLIGYFIPMGRTGQFWNIVDTISRPIIFRITRIIFGQRIVNFLAGILVSITLLLAIWFFGGLMIKSFVGMLVLAGQSVNVNPYD
ncbi:MAG: YggT family protein [Treponema sp.]|nr:YggT family protein [Treponema sp.]